MKRKNTITTLSDFWNDQSTSNSNGNTSALTSNTSTLQQSDQNAINSYRNAQRDFEFVLWPG